MFRTQTYRSILQTHPAFETAQKCTIGKHLEKAQLAAQADHSVYQLHQQNAHEYFDKSSLEFELLVS